MTKKKTLDKRASQRIHAKRRARQRYGLRLNRHDLNEIKDKIKAGKATLIRRESIRVAVYRVEIHGRLADVVYDRSRATVVTFLPPKTEETGFAS